MLRTAEDMITYTLEQKMADPLAFLKKAWHPELARFRDMFVLGCHTGLRFSDYNSIRPEDIRNGNLYKKQGNSDHWVVIPLRPEAHEILVNRFNKKVPKTSNGELNRHIKKVGHLAGINTPIKVSYKKGNQDIVTTKPKYAWITTHTRRRSVYPYNTGRGREKNSANMGAQGRNAN